MPILREDILELASPLNESKKWESALIGGGTFSINPLSSIAGIKTLKALQSNKTKIYPRINAMGDKARQGIEKALVEQGIRAKCTGVASLFQTHFPFEDNVPLSSPRDIETLTDTKKRDHEFKVRLINKGFFVMHGGGAVSTAHTESEINQLIESTSEIGSEIK